MRISASTPAAKAGDSANLRGQHPNGQQGPTLADSPNLAGQAHTPHPLQNNASSCALLSFLTNGGGIGNRSLHRGLGYRFGAGGYSALRLS